MEGRARSKRHVSVLLQALVKSGRLVTRPQVVEGRQKAAEFVYAARDYATSWNLIQHRVMKGNKARQAALKKKTKAAAEVKRQARREEKERRQQNRVGQ